MKSYTFNSTLCFFLRLQLAALHFNENSCRDHAVTADGRRRYGINFSKFKKGGYIVCKVMLKQPTVSDSVHILCNGPYLLFFGIFG